ncbi:tyrosine-type recombinase/integrase [Rhizorhapis sp. SPR117]|uniref:tyrosine-type recombinase/integrase n=1 Tax=Rhizorhapis sp. SPR117 TaxID=2912611 RepID=UPI001F2D50B4|nr:site-specific integrase [Rhizorhapis sp. SPR117]
MALSFRKLTRAAVRSLNAGECINEHGIRAERLHNGDVRYGINIMVDKARIHRVIGKESEGVTRAQAERAIEAFRTKAREERLDLPRGRKIALLFADAGKAYIERLKVEGGKTIERKERAFSLHLNPYFGKMSLSNIATSDFAKYRTRRKAAGANDATINREMAVISHLFSKAVEWAWIIYRPKIIRAKEGNGRINYLTTEQCGRVMKAAMKDVSPHIYPFTVIALSTSMRMTEILSMRPEHIDLVKKRVLIPNAKAGARDQPITSALADFLMIHVKNLPVGAKWLFPNSGSASGRLVTIRKAHRRVIEAAGLNPNEVVRHTFRHTAITHLVQAGVDLPTVQKVSGHKTLSMVARYSHANGTHIDAAMNRLEERIALTK